MDNFYKLLANVVVFAKKGEKSTFRLENIDFWLLRTTGIWVFRCMTTQHTKGAKGVILTDYLHELGQRKLNSMVEFSTIHSLFISKTTLIQFPTKTFCRAPYFIEGKLSLAQKQLSYNSKA